MTGATGEMTGSRASASRDWLTRYFWRVGHVWVENPWRLVEFAIGLARSVVEGIVDPRRGAWGRTAVESLRQTGKTFFRGLFPVLFLGLAFGLGLGLVTADFTGLLRATFERTVLFVLLRDGLPLLLVVFLTARTGGTLAAKFAEEAPDERAEPVPLHRRVLPHLVAASLTSAGFFLALVACVLGGYAAHGVAGQASAGLSGYFGAFGVALGGGVLRSALFGGIVAFAGAGVGSNAAGRRAERHYAVWESTVISIAVCTVLTILLWEPLP